MHAVLGTELRDRQLAPDRLECYFRFEFSVVTLACRLGHLYSSFPKDEPSLSCCPIRGDPLCSVASMPCPRGASSANTLRASHHTRCRNCLPAGTANSRERRSSLAHRSTWISI